MDILIGVSTVTNKMPHFGIAVVQIQNLKFWTPTVYAYAYTNLIITICNKLLVQWLQAYMYVVGCLCMLLSIYMCMLLYIVFYKIVSSQHSVMAGQLRCCLTNFRWLQHP